MSYWEINAKPIYFNNNKNDDYYEFSNFYEKSINIDGIVYNSNEHYFQSQKFNYQDASKNTKEYFKKILLVDSPYKATDMGIQRINHRGCFWYLDEKKPKLGLMNDIIHQYTIVSIAKKNPNWEAIQIEIMRKGLEAKFHQYSSLKRLLLETGQRKIIYNNPNDKFWGSEENHLGKLIMELRTSLQQK